MKLTLNTSPQTAHIIQRVQAMLAHTARNLADHFKPEALHDLADDFHAALSADVSLLYPVPGDPRVLLRVICDHRRVEGDVLQRALSPCDGVTSTVVRPRHPGTCVVQLHLDPAAIHDMELLDPWIERATITRQLVTIDGLSLAIPGVSPASR